MIYGTGLPVVGQGLRLIRGRGAGRERESAGGTENAESVGKRETSRDARSPVFAAQLRFSRSRVISLLPSKGELAHAGNPEESGVVVLWQPAEARIMATVSLAHQLVCGECTGTKWLPCFHPCGCYTLVEFKASSPASL